MHVRAEEKTYEMKNVRYKNILLVDDSLKSIEPLNIIFKQLGCNTYLAFDADNAVDEVLKTNIDLIILDWRMPSGTGGQTLEITQKKFDQLERQWNEKKHIKPIPVIIYSGVSSLEMNIPRCKNFQIIDFWLKPLDYLATVQRATRVISNYKS